jgi:hypothetical protein
MLTKKGSSSNRSHSWHSSAPRIPCCTEPRVENDQSDRGSSARGNNAAIAGSVSTVGHAQDPKAWHRFAYLHEQLPSATLQPPCALHWLPAMQSVHEGP